MASDPIEVLVRLQWGDPNVLSGDTAKAKSAYQDFLTLWKDADSEIPSLKQAKAEIYANPVATRDLAFYALLTEIG